jgi:hypothetical protein
LPRQRHAFRPFGHRASRGLRFSGQPDITEHVVGDIGHADLHLGPANANGSDEELHLVLLPGEDQLRYGLAVTLLGIPCADFGATEAGIELVGPGYFGYTITCRYIS